MATYIHEQGDWPHLTWDHKQLEAQLAAVRLRQGKLIGRMETLGFQRRAEAVLETLTADVLKSSEIEGEQLDKGQVRSSIARRLGMDIGALTPADRHVEGVVEMMLDATQNHGAPLTDERLFAWHAALFPTGRSGMSRILVGAWRDAASGPMHVVSGPIGREHVHFEAPPAERMEAEMSAFLVWFNGADTLDPILKAALAHLWFVTIHPFADGNGWIARHRRSCAGPPEARATLLQHVRANSPRAERLLRHPGAHPEGRARHYRLAAMVPGVSRIVHLTRETTFTNVLRKARFWEALAGQAFNERQKRMLDLLREGFEGKLTSSKWAIITKTSPDTALRDIDDLLRRRILVKDPAGGRSTSYSLIETPAEALRAVAAYTRAHAAISAWDGPRMPTPAETAARQRQIEDLAGEIEALAQRSEQAAVTYREFEACLTALHQQGFHPDPPLVSAVAHALSRAA